MAQLSREDILKLARLSKLDLNEDEVERFSRELPAILDYVEQLQKADVKGLEPTNQVTGLKNVTRPDEIRDYCESPSDLMKNAPAKEKGQFKVKRVI